MTTQDMSQLHNTCLMEPPSTATDTVTSSPVNLQAYDSVSVWAIFGESGDTLSSTVKWTFTLTECDTYDGTYTDVDDTEIVEGSNSVVVDAAAEDDFAYRLTYIGNAKYIKGVVTKTGTHTYGTPIAVLGVLGNKKMGPTASTSVAVATA